jgi:DNA-nicking Smr family endonuclease
MGRKQRNRNPGGVPAFGGFDALLDATPVATLDLHGDLAHEAERRVRDFLRTQARISRGKVVHVITGRGRGSAGRPVLPSVVRRVLGEEEVARLVAEHDRDLDDGGVLIRLR